MQISKLVLASGCVLLAATGCGATGEPVDTQADPSSLHGGGQVQGARGDRNWDEKDDQVGAGQGTAGAAANPGAAGAAPTDKPGRGPGRFDPDSDGGVDENCEFGDGFRGQRWGHRNGGGRNDRGGDPGEQRDRDGRGDKPERGDAGPEPVGDAGPSDEDQAQGRGGRR